MCADQGKVVSMQIRVELSLCSVKQYVIKRSTFMLHKPCLYMVMCGYLHGNVWLSTLVGPLTSWKDPWWAHTRSEGFENRKGQLPRRESSQDSCVVPFVA
jgi:hypothetical protein